MINTFVKHLRAGEKHLTITLDRFQEWPISGGTWTLGSHIFSEIIITGYVSNTRYLMHAHLFCQHAPTPTREEKMAGPAEPH